MELLEGLAESILFHLLAFIPIFAKLAIISASKKKLEEWYQVIQDGELYIYSTTLSAWSMTLILFQGRNINSLEDRFIIMLLILNLLISTLLFGIASHYKWVKQDPENFLELNVYAGTSIACSFIAIFCSYYISGVK